MKKLNLFQKISCLTVVALIATSLSTLTSFANPSIEETQEPVSSIADVLATEEVQGITTDVELDKEVLSKDFDLAEAVENVSIQEMNKEEKKQFNNVVEEQVTLLGLEGEEKEAYQDALISFFDENSDTYNNLGSAQEELETELEEIPGDNSTNQVSFLNDALTQTVGVNTASASIKGDIKIGVNFAGSVLNVAIGVAVGGGVGAIQSFIINKGKKEAQRIFTKTVTSRLKAWGADKLAWAVGAAVAIALDYTDVGTMIAKQIDKRDKKPNNGWINIY
ncbi:hypothetical protein [Niallia sp. 01092]|uniref:hypothetical protein n=1 Tax=unclassified Niallia TaxID=2837522 RepID=UPI003FD35B6C